MNSSMDLTKLTYFDSFKSTGGVMSQLISHKKNPLTSFCFFPVLWFSASRWQLTPFNTNQILEVAHSL